MVSLGAIRSLLSMGIAKGEKIMKAMLFVSGLIAGLPLLLVGCGSGASSNQPSTNGEGQVVNVTAQDFKWTLDKTVLKAGEPIDFKISVKEGAHGFSIDGTNITKSVMQGQTYDVNWTPPKPGTYTVRCDQVCGSGHANMFTTFTVS
jgi:cytochrome c oxidase subunit II